MSTLIQLDWHGKSAVLTLCREQVKNAINLELMDAWAEQLSVLENTPALHSLIIASQGTESFIAGGDLADLHRLKTEGEVKSMSLKMAGILERMEKLPVPVIAAIEGYAFGGGWEIMCACDLRLCAENTKIGFRQVYWGLTPGWAGTARLVREVGKSWASWLLMTNQTMHAAEALQIGLVHRVVKSGQVLQSCKELAQRLEGYSGPALGAIKASVLEASTLPMPQALHNEQQRFAKLWLDYEHTSRVEAFLKKE